LRFPSHAVYIQGVREVYEAYVIYCFLQYLVLYLGSNRLELARKLARKPPSSGEHGWPFCLLSPWTMGLEFLDKCRLGVLQLVVVRCCTTVGAGVCSYRGTLGEGTLRLDRGFVWVTLFNSCSAGFALYALYLFYKATAPDMVAIRPLNKFLTIKAIVFLSYWQGIMIGLLVGRGILTGIDVHSAEMVARWCKDLLVCVEMFFAAVAYLFFFPVSEYQRPRQKIDAPPAALHAPPSFDASEVPAPGRPAEDSHQGRHAEQHAQPIETPMVETPSGLLSPATARGPQRGTPAPPPSSSDSQDMDEEGGRRERRLKPLPFGAALRLTCLPHELSADLWRLAGATLAACANAVAWRLRGLCVATGLAGKHASSPAPQPIGADGCWSVV